MDRDAALPRALTAFVQYGFRKASMEDVARAVGVSRQALYNHFGSKDGLFRETVTHAFEGALAGASAALEDPSVAPRERLFNALDAWSGEYVEMLRASPHGTELLDVAQAELVDVKEASEATLRGRLTRFVRAEKLAAAGASPADVAKTLLIAAKGLFHATSDRAEFRKGLRTALRALTPSESSP